MKDVKSAPRSNTTKHDGGTGSLILASAFPHLAVNLELWHCGHAIMMTTSPTLD